MKKLVIGITGKARHGKDTFAKYLKQGLDIYLLNSANVQIIRLSDPLKDMAKKAFLWDDDTIENKKDEIDKNYGISPRQVLQTLGTEWGQFTLSVYSPEFASTTGRKLWIKNILSRIKNSDIDIAIVPDVRFVHEHKEFFDDKEVLYFSIKIIRPDFQGITESNHVSETEMDAIVHDIEIYNDSTLSDLQRKATKLIVPRILSLVNRVYVAGGISKVENFNYNNFMRVKEILESYGWEVHTPFDLDLPKNLPWDLYMHYCLPKMLMCPHVYMLNGWEDSDGACMEHQIAVALKKRIFYESRQDLLDGSFKW